MASSALLRRMRLWLLAMLSLFAALPAAQAQGDGPRSQILIPTGVNIFVPSYLHLSGNLSLGDQTLRPDADITSDVFVGTYMRSFALGERYAQIWVNPIYGRIKAAGSVTTGNQRRAISAKESGLMDLPINFKIGLLGAKPLSIKEMGQQNQDFQLSAFASVGLPIGEYDRNKSLNLGSNIWTLRVGAPMVIPLAIGSPRPNTWLETFPSYTIYQDNDEPTGGARRVEKRGLVGWENHLSHNFTPAFWASLDLRYRYGGATKTDGIADNNKTNIWGGGFSLSYSVTPTFSVQSTFGHVFTGSKAEEEMVRIKLVITH